MILVEEGPSSIIVEARGPNKNEPEVELISEELRRLLGQISEFVPILKLKAKDIKNLKHIPWVVKRMLEASKLICADELTGLASVAGAIADEIKRWLMGKDYDFVFVNNGGDISLYSAYNGQITTGIFGLDGNCLARLKIQGPFDIGIATSGFGGRSFTKGIADSVTVLAKNASVADAAATFIANHVNVDSCNVKRDSAGRIDSTSDICSEAITVEVGDLKEEERLKAIQNGFICAQRLKEEGYIFGFVLIVQGSILSCLPKGSQFKLEVKHVDKKDCNDSGGDPWGWGEVFRKTHQEGGFCSGYKKPLCRCL